MRGLWLVANKAAAWSISLNQLKVLDGNVAPDVYNDEAERSVGEFILRKRMQDAKFIIGGVLDRCVWGACIQSEVPLEVAQTIEEKLVGPLVKQALINKKHIEARAAKKRDACARKKAAHRTRTQKLMLATKKKYMKKLPAAKKKKKKKKKKENEERQKAKKGKKRKATSTKKLKVKKIPAKRFSPSWAYTNDDGKAHYGGFSSRHLAYLGLSFFGLNHAEIAPLLEGLDHAIDCKPYVFRGVVAPPRRWLARVYAPPQRSSALKGILRSVDWSYVQATKRLEIACRKRLDMEDAESALLRSSDLAECTILDLKSCVVESNTADENKSEVELAMTSMLNKLELTRVFPTQVHQLAVAVASRRRISQASLLFAQETRQRLRTVSLQCLHHVATIIVNEAKKDEVTTMVQVVDGAMRVLRPGRSSSSGSGARGEVTSAFGRISCAKDALGHSECCVRKGAAGVVPARWEHS